MCEYFDNFLFEKRNLTGPFVFTFPFCYGKRRIVLFLALVIKIIKHSSVIDNRLITPSVERSVLILKFIFHSFYVLLQYTEFYGMSDSMFTSGNRKTKSFSSYVVTKERGAIQVSHDSNRRIG